MNCIDCNDYASAKIRTEIPFESYVYYCRKHYKEKVSEEIKNFKA